MRKFIKSLDKNSLIIKIAAPSVFTRNSLTAPTRGGWFSRARSFWWDPGLHYNTGTVSLPKWEPPCCRSCIISKPLETKYGPGWDLNSELVCSPLHHRSPEIKSHMWLTEQINFLQEHLVFSTMCKPDMYSHVAHYLCGIRKCGQVHHFLATRNFYNWWQKKMSRTFKFQPGIQKCWNSPTAKALYI